jgi:predicted TIM-barrel fold metal-dependent hydrolase
MKLAPALAALLLAAHPAAGGEATRLVDHHVHVLGPGLVRDWKSLGVPFSREDSAYTSAARYFEPAAEGPGAGRAVAAAILVPMAHLYGREGFRQALELPVEEERRRVAAENDHVAAEAERLGERAVAFCSVPLRRPYTFDELARCRDELGGRGLKLHLAASVVDLTAIADRRDVGRALAEAAEGGLAVLLHLDPQRRGLEAADVDRFLDEALGPVPELEIVIAHLGGSGGFGPWTQSVLGTITAWLARRAEAGEPRAGVFVDLSAVILAEPSEGVPATTTEEAAALAPALRRLGLERVVFASDAPVFDPRDYAALLAERSGLTAAELESITSRRMPVLARSTGATARP